MRARHARDRSVIVNAAANRKEAFVSQSPSPSVFVALGVAAGLLGSADPGPAQEKPASPPSVVQESAGVTLIEIPVNVIGKDGKPVAGLSVDDFELFDDGKKQPINGLEVIDLSKPAPAGPSGQPEAIPASARRLWLFVFDLSYTSPSGLVRARDGAREFVTKAMQPNDLAAVGTLSTETGWKLLVNFTRDRRQLGWAIDTLGLAPEQRASDPLSFAYVPPGPSGPSGSPATGPRDGDILENMRDIQRLQKVSTDEQARGRVTKLMTNLSGIGRVLDSTRGRKHVLFFSEGFETRLLSGHMASGDRSSSLSAQPISSAAQDTATVQGTGDAALSGELWKVDSDARFGNTATRSVLLEALALFARSDAVLDTIDISGLRAESDATGAKAGSGTDALFAMAAATDGDLIRNANQLGGELAKLEERTALVYLLIYQPAQLSKPGAFHQLRVRTKAPGARVLARSGYYEPRPYQNLSPLEKLLTAGDLVTGGSREN
ncbi:MAG TPA: VWA domain-containing protein, partial [Thermoanaerobaculia bacterium]